MYFKFSLRKHPQTQKLSGYYRLVESYRNADHRVCHRTILNVGFMEDVTPDQLNIIQKQLTERYEGKQTIFEQRQDDPKPLKIWDLEEKSSPVFCTSNGQHWKEEAHHPKPLKI